MIELCGWIGGIAFSLCAIPQAYSCYQSKSAQGISTLFIILWAVGEILTTIYVLLTIHSPQLILNYAANFLCLLVIIFYKLVGNKQSIK